MKSNASGMITPTLGLTAEKLGLVARGWSIKKDILGKNVYNEKNDDLGIIEDMLVTRDEAISYAIIGVGGFLGVGRHDVAIPVRQLRMNKAKVTLPGATACCLEALPAYEHK
ncbi:MAG: PRC-barrel domain-containing protein [Desulfovibrionaceae bacterium]|nr:PRC-barrel domain-containing protein [Desulfovibrionaceae bacterium]